MFTTVMIHISCWAACQRLALEEHPLSTERLAYTDRCSPEKNLCVENLVLVEYVVNQFLVHPCQSARRGEFDSSSFLLLEVNIWLVAV